MYILLRTLFSEWDCLLTPTTVGDVYWNDSIHICLWQCFTSFHRQSRQQTPLSNIRLGERTSNETLLTFIAASMSVWHTDL